MSRKGPELDQSLTKVMSKGQKTYTERPLAPAYFYILRLRSGTLYIGTTTDLDQRYKDHCSGKACRTTKFDPPLELVYTEKFDTFSEARKRESQVKHWSRAKKEALIVGDIGTLQILSKSRKCK